LLHSCPRGVRKSTLHGPWQIRVHPKSANGPQQDFFALLFPNRILSPAKYQNDQPFFLDREGRALRVPDFVLAPGLIWFDLV
jgi:hypothetical protein